MLATQAEVLDVPVGLTTVLQIRESSPFPRVLFFRNLTDATIAATVEKSTDGGTTWSTVVASFNVGAIGSGTEVVAQTITATDILRVRASGGGDDRDLMVGFCRMILDSGDIWTAPVL